MAPGMMGGLLATDHLLFNPFEGLALGFGNEMQHERDGQCGEHAEDRERTAHIVAEGRKEHEEELGDHEIAKPVGGGSEGAADAAHAEREDLTDEHPGDRTPGEREAKDIDGNQNHGRHGQSGYIAGEVEDGKRRKRNGHDHGSRRPAASYEGTCP